VYDFVKLLNPEIGVVVQLIHFSRRLFMARPPRSIVAKVPHHIICRGVAQQPVFLDDEDRERYLACLKRVAAAVKVDVHAYVLMTNHVHLLASGQEDESLSQLMQQLGRLYVRRFNERHERSGTLWEGRFRASAIDSDRYFFECMRYIELNPVRAGMVTQPDQYRWSSYRHHAGIESGETVSDHFLYWNLGNTPFEREAAYKEIAAAALPPQDVQRMTERFHAGRPLGRDSFVAELSAKLGRSLEPRKAGRPKMEKPVPVAARKRKS
jgi:putative transposase